MRFFLLSRTPRGHHKIPLDASDDYPGAIHVKCDECSTYAAKHAPVDLLVEIIDVAPLEDIEQAFTTLLVSKKFRDPVLQHNLTGLRFRDVLDFRVATKKKGAAKLVRQCTEDFRFKALWAAGSGGSIADSSNLHLVKKCHECGWEEWSVPKDGVFIDESQWDGSDFFQVKELPGPVFMTERAVEVLIDTSLSNFQAKPAEEHRPGRL